MINNCTYNDNKNDNNNVNNNNDNNINSYRELSFILCQKMYDDQL